LSQDITKVEQERKSLKQKEQQQSLEITRLEGNVTFLEVEREKQELEMRQFLDKYETKSLSWRQALEDRDKEVERLRKQLEGKSINSLQTNSSSSQSQQQEEHIKLRHVRRNLYIAYIFLVLVDTTSLPYDHLNLFVPSTFSVVFSSRTTCSVV